MYRRIAICLLPVLAVGIALGAGSRSAPEAPLAHMVFFSLKDRTKDARDAFVASCQKYLAGHEGATYFSVGTIAEDAPEPVSVLDFDVALHVVFENKEAKAKYLKSPRHDNFVAENKEKFAKVRVFDSYLVPSK
jgi:Stress responsive A/B Barrel Domain